jgi:hypothetical protein
MTLLLNLMMNKTKIETTLLKKLSDARKNDCADGGGRKLTLVEG